MPPPVVPVVYILLLKTVVNRLSRETFRVYPGLPGQRREATRGTTRNRRDGRAEVIAEIRTAFSYGRTVIRQF